MKKVLMVGMGVILLTAVTILAGNNLSRSQAASALQSALSDEGYNCDVEVGDVDENGADDFAVEYNGGNEDKQIIELIGSITGGVAALSELINWKADKVFLLVGEDLYYATVRDCVKCYDLVEQDWTDDDDIIECLNDVWTEHSQ